MKYFLISIFTIMWLILLMINLNWFPQMILFFLMIYSMLMFYSMNFWKKNYLMSFLSFLMIIGGIMILFLYFMMIFTKNITKINWFNLNLYLILSSFLLYNLIIMFKYIHIENYFLNYIFINFNMNKIYSIFKFYTLISMFYLMIILIIIIKMCTTINQPMRTMY